MAAPVVVSSLPPGTALSRYLIVKGLGGLGTIDPDAPAWRQTPHVIQCLRDELLTTKAATPAGNTSDAAWASPLAAYGIAREALALRRDVSILARRAAYATGAVPYPGAARNRRGNGGRVDWRRTQYADCGDHVRHAQSGNL